MAELRELRSQPQIKVTEFTELRYKRYKTITKGSLLIGNFKSLSAAKAIAQSHWIEMRLSILKEPIRGNEIPWLLVSVHPVRAVDRRWWGLVAFVEMCGDCGEVKG